MGLLEGEATFVPGPPSSPNSPIVRVLMTDRDIVDRVGALFDRAVVPLRSRKDGYKRPYATVLKGAEAVDLMIAARSFVGPSRRRQIDVAVASQKTSSRRFHRQPRETCAASGCVRPARTRGLCRTHYKGWWKATRAGRVPLVNPIVSRSRFDEEVKASQCDCACDVA